MEKKKIILTIIGVAALAIPVALLIWFSNQNQIESEAPSGSRVIDPRTIQDVKSKIPTPTPIVLPSPSPATDSADLDLEGSPSAE